MLGKARYLKTIVGLLLISANSAAQNGAYDNPGTRDSGGHIWLDEGAGSVAGSGDVEDRAQRLAARALRLGAETEIENLQRIFGADGWARNASGFVPGPSADYPPDAPPSFEFKMWPTVYYIPFHYTDPVAH